ncbi:MAG TPA: carboxypeptidase-like regulatory domain-containing protein [Longimicrobium sp.]|nr:carboxypeptidase-like regulatory domain-containing protein [Longimicrobium sp.]
MSRVVASLGAMMLVVLCARAAGAQTVRGTVVDARSGHPVPGAVVVLLDENGRRHGAVLSGAAGDRCWTRAAAACAAPPCAWAPSTRR